MSFISVKSSSVKALKATPVHIINT